MLMSATYANAAIVIMVTKPEKPLIASPTNSIYTGHSRYIIKRIRMASIALPTGGASRAGRRPPVSVHGPRKMTMKMDGIERNRTLPMSIFAAMSCTCMITK